tara:strand:+ start:322 stop:1509 length:1188 start_codon:yes stop_codon:yes gene_type:complete
MSSQQKTAEYFRNKSDEEIIEWMLKNLSTDQIKTCLGDDSTPSITPVDKGVITVDDLRKWCSNKKYVIQKIEDDKVYFWYFENTSKKWTYYVFPLDKFPQSMGATAEECDPGDELNPEQLTDLKQHWNDTDLGPNKNYETNKLPDMPDSQVDAFNEIMKDYEFDENLRPKGYVVPGPAEPLEDSSVITTAMDQRQQAINYQKQTSVDPETKLSGVINFSPVLIEGADDNNVYFYYVIFNPQDKSFNVKGNQSDTDVAKVPLDECKDKFMEILSNFSKLSEYISLPGEGGGSSDETKAAESWKVNIKEAVNTFFSASEAFEKDLTTIKALYEAFPLTELEGSRFFMSGLFSASQFGKRQFNNINEYVTNLYGKKFTELFKPKIVENKFGYKTLIYT